MGDNMSKKDEKNYRSRSERNREKHKKSRELNENVQSRRGFSIVLIVLFAILIFLLYLIFSGEDESDQANTSSEQISIAVRDDSDTADETETDTSEDYETNSTSDTTAEEEDTEAEEEDAADEEAPQNTIEEQNADNNLEEVEPSDDAVAAYEGDWDPIGTEQSDSHTTNYSSGSQDRLEIKEAAANVTGLDYNTMIEHWVGNDGTNQGVHATVSDRQQSEFYRVHLTWNDGGGWQVQSVEILE